MTDPNPERLNSAHVFVRDAQGSTFLHVFLNADPEEVKKAQKHARWYIRHRQRPQAYLDKTTDGRPVPSPIGKAEVVTEYYQDATAFALPGGPGVKRKRSA